MTAPIEAASILAVGSELLGTTKLDTNSLFLTGELETLGISVLRKACVGDDWEGLLSEISTALSRAPLLVITGGLGPTADDRTKEAVAHIFDRRLLRDDEILSRLKQRFLRRGMEMPKVNEKQADVIEGSVVLHNPVGTAPGYLVEAAGKTVVLLPGVPREMKALWGEKVRPLLGRDTSASGVHRRVLKIAGMAESAVEELIKPVYAAHPEEPVTILAGGGEIELHLSARGSAEEAARKLDALEADFRKAVGAEIYGRDTETLEGVAGELLRLKGKTVALAESCTGGTLAGRMTDVAGSSDYFLGAAITYANSAKVEMLGVSPSTLEKFGAVSEETAREMAAGVRRQFGSSIGLSVTGIAGPGGGTPEKPVGTVFLALDSDDGARHGKRLLLPGERAMIRSWTTSAALLLLRNVLLGRLSPGR
ncbi:MAG: competence/damage-inducible protein A [Thermoanaerobaculia bacterium]|nr:competence/damage-inducible protein A [Thermoanaerobaculia bacterium]